MPKTKHDVSLKDYCSFGVGGKADTLVELTGSELGGFLKDSPPTKPIWLLGYGSNSLISDSGLLGTVLVLRGGEITLDEKTTVIADVGVDWDKMVSFAIDQGLWGVELMSGIPGGVGAGVVGNIAAYGQAVGDTLVWVEVVDRETAETSRLSAADLDFGYRTSKLAQPAFENLIITRAAFKLHERANKPLEYGSALAVAEKLGLSPGSLKDRRQIILETRQPAGSIQSKASKSAGSFFKNPLVGEHQLDEIIKHDESGRSKQEIIKQQQIHGGDKTRVSAAHVLLAAGFKRGQTWGEVRLHPDHVLKIENTGSATAQQIYDVAQEIISVVKEKLDITLESEVRFLGEFS